VHTLAEIEGAIRASWGFDTAEEDDGWTPRNPSRGQCDVTSLVLHDVLCGKFFGGLRCAPPALRPLRYRVRGVRVLERSMLRTAPGLRDVPTASERKRTCGIGFLEAWKLI